MAQGKLKTKVKMPANCKQKSTHRANKSGKISKVKSNKNNNNIQKTLQKNLECTMKKSIEQDICSQVKSVEGKSFFIVNK
jgi:hypothetical protein